MTRAIPYIFLILALVMAGCSKKSKEDPMKNQQVNITVPMAEYGEYAPAIGYLYKRFSALKMFTTSEAEELQASQLVVKRLIVKMNQESISGTLNINSFSFYLDELTKEWKVIRTILDRYKDTFPVDAEIIYSMTRKDIDNTLAATNSMLTNSSAGGDDLDWAALEKYGGVLVNALGSFVDVGKLAVF